MLKMITIKYRGRCAFSGTWRYGFYYVSKGNHIIRDEKDRESIVLEKTVGQFTGLHDKNGKEIYMGDIVTYKRSVGNWTGRTMTTTHKIIFTEEINAFVMECGSSYIKLRKHWGYEYEVIGNIFENPDLVKL